MQRLRQVRSRGHMFLATTNTLWPQTLPQLQCILLLGIKEKVVKILQIDRIEMPAPGRPGATGLLINVHMLEKFSSDSEMADHAKRQPTKEERSKFSRVAVVYWLHAAGGKERIFAYEGRLCGLKG